MGDRWFAVVLALCTVVLVVCVRWSPLAEDTRATDYQEYYRPVVESWQDGDGLTLDGIAAVKYPPGYPALLLLASAVVPGGAKWEVTSVNALSLAATVVLAFLIVRELGTRRAARWAGVGVATYPLLVYSASAPGTELAFIAFLLASIYALLRSFERGLQLAILSGALVGAAALVRPVGAPLGLVLAGLAVAWQRDRRAVGLAVLLLAANVAVIAPFQLWASSQSDEVVVLGTMGMATAVSGLAINGRDEAGDRRVPVPHAVDDLGQRALARQDELIEPGGLGAFLRAELARGPLAVVGLLLLKATRSWYGTDSLRHEPVILAVQVPYLVLGAYGGWLQRRRRLGWLCMVFIVYFWITTVAAVSIVRYLLPAMVFVVCLAMVGMSHLIDERRRRTSEPAGTGCGPQVRCSPIRHPRWSLPAPASSNEEVPQ